MYSDSKSKREKKQKLLPKEAKRERTADNEVESEN